MDCVHEPRLDSKCDSCGCVFARHYVSFDLEMAGCTTVVGQAGEPCTCSGFALVYHPKVRWDYAQQ